MLRLLFILCSFLVLSDPIQAGAASMPRAVQGSMDLQNWDFARDGVLDLKGDWSCQGLADVDECKGPAAFHSMPFGFWRTMQMVAQGRAYHSRVSLDLNLGEGLHPNLYLVVRDVMGPYKVQLIDPKTLAILHEEQHGQISSQQEESIPIGTEAWISLPSVSSVRIAIELSSIPGAYGFFRPPEIGLAENLHHMRQKTLLQMAMIIGSFVLLGLYSLVLFVQRTQDKEHLIIGILSLTLALRQMASEQLFPLIFGYGTHTFYHQSDVLFISYMASLHLFSTLLLRRANQFAPWQGPILLGFVLLLVVEVIAYAVQFFHVKIWLGVVLVILSYYIILLLLAFVSIYRVKTQDRDLSLVRLSLLLPVFGILFDACVGQMNLELPYIAHYTLLLFILSQSVLVGRKFAHSFNENERLLIEVREKEKSRTVFFHNTSHELRTPLNGIIGFLELLQGGRYGHLGDDAIAQLQKCVRLAQSLKNQVNTILDLAKSRKGTLELSNSQFRVQDLLNEAQDLAEGLLLKHKNTEYSLEIDLALQQRSWIGDYSKVATILRNLLGNAFKFADPTRTNRVKLRLALVNTDLLIEVSDTGIGIPKEQQAGIFEEFRQVEGDARRAYEGTGLGLSMVRDLARLMGGRIELESSTGLGSTFRVTIAEQKTVHMGSTPELMERQNRNSNKLPVKRKVPSQANILASRGRILVVDDNEINCEVLQDLLEGEGYEVQVAYGGLEALQKARTQPPDLMLLDMMMPLMSGEDVLQEMKQDSALEEIPVILVTARASEDDRIFGLSLGADDYLAKPIHHEELNFRVRNLLHRIETIHKTDAMEERERMAQLGDMMRELSHELKNLFQLGKLDRETIQETSRGALLLLPLQGEPWRIAVKEMSAGAYLDEPELGQLPLLGEEVQNNRLRSLRFLLGSIPISDQDRLKIWQEVKLLNSQQLEICEHMITLVRSYQLLEQQAEHATQLVASVLDYSRSSQSLGACKLDEVWATLHRLIHPRLKKNRVQILNEFASIRLPISAAHLMQILLNLVGNALDAMQSARQDQRWIRLQVFEQNGATVVSVANAGDPIPLPVQEHLFERDVSSKANAGSGLGLFICRKLVQRSMGQIRYDATAAHPTFMLIWKREEGGDAVRQVS